MSILAEWEVVIHQKHVCVAELHDMSLSTHSSIFAARESTLVPEAGKRKRGRPRKVANTDGTELAAPAPQPLGKARKGTLNLEIPQVNSEAGRKNKAVSLLLAFLLQDLY